MDPSHLTNTRSSTAATTCAVGLLGGLLLGTLLAAPAGASEKEEIWRLRHRGSFRDRPAVERAAEHTRAALWIDVLENPLEIAVETREQEPQGDGTFVIPLLVQVPLGKLALLPGEKEHRARLSLFVAVRDEKGRTSEVNRQLWPIRIANSEVLTALGQTAAYGVRLRMRGGRQKIAIRVLDEVTSLASTVNLTLDVGASGLRVELAGAAIPPGER